MPLVCWEVFVDKCSLFYVVRIMLEKYFQHFQVTPKDNVCNFDVAARACWVHRGRAEVDDLYEAGRLKRQGVAERACGKTTVRRVSCVLHSFLSINSKLFE